MWRRWLLFVLMIVLFAPDSLAIILPCMDDGDCKTGDVPIFEPGGSVPLPPGSGGPGALELLLSKQEPYRNADMGPLGVVISTGEFQITVTDMEIPGRGIPFRLSRTYRSKKDGLPTIVGYNWQMSYDEYLRPGVYKDLAGTEYNAVEWQQGNGFAEVWVEYGIYTPFLGFFGRLREKSSGQDYQIRYPDGTVKTFAQKSANAIGQEIWLLTRIEDRNGNVITLQYKQLDSTAWVIDTVTDTLGRKITFAYDDNDRLTSVTDFAGREVLYTYDDRGDLVSVRSPAGKTTTYHYLGEDGCVEEDLKHNIKSIADGKGQTFLTNKYRSDSQMACGNPGTPVDSILSQVYGEQVPANTVTYIYGSIIPTVPVTANVATTYVVVEDRNGNVQVHNLNNKGNPTTITYRTNRGVRALAGADEPDYVVTHTYVEDGSMRVSQHTESGGFNVDSSGNLAAYAEGMTVVYEYIGVRLRLAC